MWLQSPGHREILLRPSFQTVGLGLARGVWNGRPALYVTADFAPEAALASRGRHKFPRLRGFGRSRNDAHGPITGCA